MKKLISLVLCTMMIASLFAINVSAGVEVGSNQLYSIYDNFEGDVWGDYEFTNAKEVTDEDGESYYETSEWFRTYAQPVDYPDSGAYSIEFDSKFSNAKGEVKEISFYVLDKNASAQVPEVESSMDFYIRGDVNPEAKGIDVNKWYSFRVTIDPAAGISFNGYHGRLQGNGIKLEWREKGTVEWKTAVNDLFSYANSDTVQTDFGGENLKFYAGRNVWQYVNPNDMESDGIGFTTSTLFDNVKIRQQRQVFAGMKFAEDEDGYYGYSDQYARPRIQPVDFPEDGNYTIEFDSKFQSPVANEDGAYDAQCVALFVLDPALKEYLNANPMTSSIDFGIYGNVDSEAKGIDLDKWYSFKITIDRSSGLSFSNYYWRIQGDGLKLQWKERGADEWKTAENAVTTQDYTGETLKFYAGINYWQYVNKDDMTTPGIAFQTRTYMDEFALGYKEEIPTNGVVYYDDFEGATALAGNKAAIATESGNNYLAFNSDGTAWAGSGNAKLSDIPEKFILTADVYKDENCDGPLVFEYIQDNYAETGMWGQVGINAADVEAGKWYRLKIAKTSAGRSYTVTVEDLSTGEVKSIAPYSSSLQISGKLNPNDFSIRGWLNKGALNWRVDNLLLTEAVAASIPAMSYTDTSIALDVNVDAISEKVTPVVAFYNENRLVAVDWDTLDVTTDGAYAELDTVGEYDAVKILLWDTFDGAPLFGEAWDITEYLAD